MSNGRIIGRLVGTQKPGTAYIEVLAEWDDENMRYKVLSLDAAKDKFQDAGNLFIRPDEVRNKNLKYETIVECDYKYESVRDKYNDCKYSAIPETLHYYEDKSQVIMTGFDSSYLKSIKNGYITEDEAKSFMISCSSFIDEDIPVFYLHYIVEENNKEYICGPFDSSCNTLVPANQSDRISGKITEYEIENNSDWQVIDIFGRRKLLLNFEKIDLDLKSSPRGAIDCMPNSQLASWFNEKFKAFFTHEDAYYYLPDSFFDSFKGGEEITPFEQRRLNRVEQSYINLWNTYESLKTILSTKSKLSDEEPFPLIQALRNQYDKDKQKFKEEYFETSQPEFAKVLKQHNKLKDELDSLNKEIQDKKAELQKLEENKDSIINTVKIACNLLNAKENTNSGNTCEFNIDNFESFGKSEDPDFFKKQISGMRAGFINDIAIARTIARGLGNSHLFVLHVEHDWLHYEDFCKHGLIEMWKYAHEHTDENVFIVLDCINITYAEGGLKPLLDVITNKALWLLGTALKFPNNLRILATVLPWKDTEKSVGIELNKELFGSVVKENTDTKFVPCWKKYNNDTLVPYDE